MNNNYSKRIAVFATPNFKKKIKSNRLLYLEVICAAAFLNSENYVNGF